MWATARGDAAGATKAADGRCGATLARRTPRRGHRRRRLHEPSSTRPPLVRTPAASTRRQRCTHGKLTAAVECACGFAARGKIAIRRTCSGAASAWSAQLQSALGARIRMRGLFRGTGRPSQRRVSIELPSRHATSLHSLAENFPGRGSSCRSGRLKVANGTAACCPVSGTVPLPLRWPLGGPLARHLLHRRHPHFLSESSFSNGTTRNVTRPPHPGQPARTTLRGKSMVVWDWVSPSPKSRGGIPMGLSSPATTGGESQATSAMGLTAGARKHAPILLGGGKVLFKIRAQPLTAHDASPCHKY
jgi:hypothetical protein